MKNAVKILGFLSLSLVLLLGCDTTQSKKDIEQFVQIEYQYNFKNKLNTFEGYYQKDLVIDGVVKTDFWLEPEDQQQILDKADALGFFDFSEGLGIEVCKEECEITVPNSLSVLRIKHEGLDHQVEWNYLSEKFHSPEYKKARELGTFIQEIIESYPQYKKLPESTGGYVKDFRGLDVH